MKLVVMPACLVLVACTAVRPTDRAGLLHQAESFDAKHQPQEALRLVNIALKTDRSRDELNGQLCLLKSRILRDRDGIEGLERARVFLVSLPPFVATSPDTAYALKREEASVCDRLGLVGEADRNLAEAVEAARASGNSQNAARAQVTRARVLTSLHRFDDAEQCITAARDYVRRSGDHSMDAVILQYSGKVLWSSNRFEAAVAPLESAVRLFESSNKPQRAASATVDLAWVDYRLGQLDKAQRLLEDAGKHASPEDKALCVGHLGNIFYDRGDLERAIANYKLAARFARDQNQDYYSGWLTNLAMALADRKQWDEAELYNLQALRIASSISKSNALINAGRIAAGKGDILTAERQLRTVENLSDARPAERLDAYSTLAGIYDSARRDGPAKQQYEGALKLVDAGRAQLQDDENKISYLASVMKLHQRYVEFLMARGDAAGAFQVSDMSRARMLRDRLSAGNTPVHAHAVAEYQRAAARSNSAFLVYWVGRERSFLWVVAGDQFASYPLPPEEQIRGLVERYQRTFERNGKRIASDRQAGADLSAMLLEPVRKLMPDTARFVIVPDGPLYGLNFETLPVGSRYWIEDATVAIAPSLDLLLSHPAGSAGKGGLLLVGDATEWSPEFPKLLNAGREMTRIQQHFPPQAQTVFSGSQATRAAYSQSDPRKFSYIHFAAHAVANKDSPLESAIILANGKLTAKEVLATPVQARLVTISACSSAGARTYAGEGLVGLAWAFLRSGAHGVIAGLWDVSDYSSPILMESLYGGLARGQEPADALRAAKLKLLEPGSKFADPYYWGAFQLYLGPASLQSRRPANLERVMASVRQPGYPHQQGISRF